MESKPDPNLRWIVLIIGATVVACCFLVTSCEQRRYAANERVRWISQDFSWAGYDGPVTKTSEVK